MLYGTSRDHAVVRVPFDGVASPTDLLTMLRDLRI